MKELKDNAWEHFVLKGDCVYLRVPVAENIPEIIRFYRENTKHFDVFASPKPEVFYTAALSVLKTRSEDKLAIWVHSVSLLQTLYWDVMQAELVSAKDAVDSLYTSSFSLGAGKKISDLFGGHSCSDQCSQQQIYADAWVACFHLGNP